MTIGLRFTGFARVGDRSGRGLALALLVLGLSAAAATPQTRPRFDLDRDGKVTRDEFRTVRVEQIMRLDRDRDGRVTRGESRAVEGIARVLGGKAARARMDELWTLGDANRDGALTREEAASVADRRFPLYDHNKDGWLDPAELVAVRTAAPSPR